MTTNTFLAVNCHIEEERRSKYCGTACIKVSSLQFCNESSRNSPKDSAAALKRVFKEERGCRQLEARHHVKAIISPDTLEAALSRSGLSIESLLQDTLPYPQLELPDGFTVECIQGLDRLTAADQALHGGVKTWVVDLFLNDLSDDLRRMLIEDYDYQKKPDDGELYVKIREYQGKHGRENKFFERLWLGRLSVNKNRKNNFDQLERHANLKEAFDKLLDIPALFGGFRLSVIHHLISMRCDEVRPRTGYFLKTGTNILRPNVHYLTKRLYKWWKKACNGDCGIMRRIDRPTVEALQGKAPGACKADYNDLNAMVKAGHIFAGFDPTERERLWAKVCRMSRKYLIPSLHTFFEDRKYLSSAADCLKRLVEIEPRSTLIASLETSFTDNNQHHGRCLVQVSARSFGYIPGNEGTRQDLGVRQLWLAAFRHHQDLPAETRKKNLLAKPRPIADSTVLFELASLAERFGFESKKISKIIEVSPDRIIAERALLSARKPEAYEYHDVKQSIQRIVEIFATATAKDEAAASEDTEAVNFAQHSRRHGIPHSDHHNADKASLFFPILEKRAADVPTRIPSLFITKSIYTAYFGKPPPTANYQIIEEAPSLQQNIVPLVDMIRRGLNPSIEDSFTERTPVSPMQHSASGESETGQYQARRAELEAELEQIRSLTRSEQNELQKVKNEISASVEQLRMNSVQQEQMDQQLAQYAEREAQAQAILHELELQIKKERERLHELELQIIEEEQRLHALKMSVDLSMKNAQENIQQQRNDKEETRNNTALVLYKNVHREPSIQISAEHSHPVENSINANATYNRRGTHFAFDKLIANASVENNDEPADGGTSGHNEENAHQATSIDVSRDETNEDNTVSNEDPIQLWGNEPEFVSFVEWGDAVTGSKVPASDVKTTAIDFIKEGYLLFDRDGNQISVERCLARARATDYTITLKKASEVSHKRKNEDEHSPNKRRR